MARLGNSSRNDSEDVREALLAEHHLTSRPQIVSNPEDNSIANNQNRPSTTPTTDDNLATENASAFNFRAHASSSISSGSDEAGPSLDRHLDGSSFDLEMQRMTPQQMREERERRENEVRGGRVARWFHRIVPIRQTYERLHNGINTGRMVSNQPGRFIGQGTDGVFRNLMAKPDTDRQEQELSPPLYEEAAADAAPEYWESTIISPMYEDEVFVKGLPVGSIANFMWNILVTVAFQFVGFVLCYLLHTSHASKQGARAGIGITLVMYGYNIVPKNFGHVDQVPHRYVPANPNIYDIDKSVSIKGDIDSYNSDLFQQFSGQNINDTFNSTPYLAYGTIALGLLIIVKLLVDYYKVKLLERSMLAPHTEQINLVTAPAE